MPGTGFDGFPPTTFTFLRDLGAHNEKAWFDAHRADYETAYLAPALAFIEAIGDPLRALDPSIHAEARVNGSLFRVNRDVRFSRDKTPYKDHLDLFFWSGEGRSRERPGYFLRLRADALLTGAGMHGFDPGRLARFRAAVLDETTGVALEDAVAAAERAGATVEGLGYRSVPAGLDANHPRARFLRHNALHAGFAEELPPAIGSAAFVDHCVERFRPLAPLLAWVARI